MSCKVFIDGSSGTTGLRIAERLARRPELELLSIPEAGRKDLETRAEVINAADLAFLCLPDAASREILSRIGGQVKVLDTSTAFRTAPGWVYGFPELHGQREANPRRQPGGGARVPCFGLHRPGPAPGGAGAGPVGLPLHLPQPDRLFRRRQKNDRRIRGRQPPRPLQHPPGLWPDPAPQAPARDAGGVRPGGPAGVLPHRGRLLFRHGGHRPPADGSAARRHPGADRPGPGRLLRRRAPVHRPSPGPAARGRDAGRRGPCRAPTGWNCTAPPAPTAARCC